MSTDEAELQAASNKYAGDLVERYGSGPDRIPPRDLDAILDKVAGKGGDVTMLEKQLSGYVTMREVNKAKEHVDFKQVSEDFDDKLTQMLEDAGWDTPPVDHEVPPEPEPQPYGQRQIAESDSWETTQTRYGNGEIDEETYTRERKAQGLAPLH